jgi:hypothetical protein
VVITTGNWELELTNAHYAALGNGTVSLQLIGTDDNGNQTVTTQVIPIAANLPKTPTILSVQTDTGLADYVTTDAAALKIYGTSTPGDTLAVSYTWTPAAGGLTATGTVPASYLNMLTGTWTAILPDQTVDGEYTLNVTAGKDNLTSVAGTTAIVVNAVTPAAPVITVALNSNRPTLTGTAANDSLVSIYLGGEFVAAVEAGDSVISGRRFNLHIDVLVPAVWTVNSLIVKPPRHFVAPVCSTEVDDNLYWCLHAIRRCCTPRVEFDEIIGSFKRCPV